MGSGKGGGEKGSNRKARKNGGSCGQFGGMWSEGEKQGLERREEKGAGDMRTQCRDKQLGRTKRERTHDWKNKGKQRGEKCFTLVPFLSRNKRTDRQNNLKRERERETYQTEEREEREYF